MSFNNRIKCRRVGEASVEVSVNLSDVLEQFGFDQLMRVWNDNNPSMEMDIVNLISENFEGGIKAFCEKWGEAKG